MTTNSTTLAAIEQRIAAAINTSRAAKVYEPETNPLHSATLDTLIRGAGILKHADLMPQRNAQSGAMMGSETLNGVVIDGLQARANGRRDQRKTVSRARAQRMQQINAIADSPVIPDPERMTMAWAVVRPMVPIVTRIANSKASWARRYLGAVQDDVAQVAMTKMALVLAKSDHDMDLLMAAALQLAGEVERTGALPGHQEDKDAKRERKAQAKTRKWLMGMANNRVMGALCDLYTERANLRWENLDVLDTIMASINGSGEDPSLSSHNASKAPCFIASRMLTPGSINPDVLRAAIAGAITDRRLDALCELLTNETHLRTDGSFTWTEHAEDVFMATPDGEHKWDAVCRATQHHADPAHSRAHAARMYARGQFEFLPWIITSVIQACDAERVGWRDGYAIMASAFDPDSFADDGSRSRPGYLVPNVVFADVAQASKVIAESLACVLAEWDFDA